MKGPGPGAETQRLASPSSHFGCSLLPILRFHQSNHCVNGLKPCNPPKRIQEDGCSEFEKNLETRWKNQQCIKILFLSFQSYLCPKGRPVPEWIHIFFFFFWHRQKFLLQVAPAPSEGQCITQIIFFFSNDVYSLVWFIFDVRNKMES